MVDGPPYEGTGKAQRELAERLVETSDGDGVFFQTLAEVDLKNKNTWIFRESFTRSTTTSSLEFLIQHPSSASNPLRIVKRKIDPTKALTGRLSFNVGITTSGTDFDVTNAYVESDMSNPDPTPTMEYGGDYDKGAGTADALPVDVFDTGVGVQRVARDASSAAFRMNPGTNVYYDLDSQADSNDIVVEFIVSEQP